MLKKKLLAVAASAALVLPAFSFSSLAANGEIKKVGDLNVKVIQDFDALANGMRIGQNGDKTFACSLNVDEKGCIYEVKDNVGVDGSKGLFEGANSKIKATGEYSSFTYYFQKGMRDYAGGTDFVFWIDNSFQQNKDSAFEILFQEWDYNEDGTPAKQINPQTDEEENKPTVWGLKDTTSSTWYTLEDGKWVEHTDGTPGWYVHIPKGYKGYVRMPFSCFEPWWSTTDKNNTFDLKNVQWVQMYYGIYPRDVNGAFNLDDLSFAGNYQLATTTTTGASTTAQPTVTTTTAADKTNPSSADTTAAPVQNDTTTTASSSESPKTGEMPITAALVTAVTFAGVLVASKKRNK